MSSVGAAHSTINFFGEWKKEEDENKQQKRGNGHTHALQIMIVSTKY